jgi:Uma2 family endonuclease
MNIMPATASASLCIASSDIFRLSVEKYHEMIRTGVLTDDDPIELIEGVLVFKMPKDEPHNVCVTLVNQYLSELLDKGWSYRNQSSLTLYDSEPEPDGAVVRGDVRYYVRQNRKPEADDTAMVIEVADSSLPRDRTTKLRSYARAGIAVYWIINLIDRVIEVYSMPQPLATPEPMYGQKQTYDTAGEVPVIIEGATLGTLKVADVLP